MTASGATSTSGMLMKGLFALTLVGSMVTLVVVLVGESHAGRDAIDAYLANIAGGTDVSAAIGGDEAAELTEVLRSTRGFSIENFQGQSDTACFLVELDLGETSTEARFLLAEHGDARTVLAASLRRECDCPEDAAEDCRLH